MVETVDDSDRWFRSELNGYNFHALASARKIGGLTPALACSVFGLTPSDVQYLAHCSAADLRPLSDVNVLLFYPYCVDSEQRGLTFFEYCLQFPRPAAETHFPANPTPLIWATDDIIRSVTHHLWFLVTMLAVRSPERCALLLRVPISRVERFQNLQYVDIEHQLETHSIRFEPAITICSGDPKRQYRQMLRMMSQ